MTPMVQAQEVCKSFGALNVLKGITLEVGKGEVMCMVGPSGSGGSAATVTVARTTTSAQAGLASRLAGDLPLYVALYATGFIFMPITAINGPSIHVMIAPP